MLKTCLGRVAAPSGLCIEVEDMETTYKPAAIGWNVPILAKIWPLVQNDLKSNSPQSELRAGPKLISMFDDMHAIYAPNYNFNMVYIHYTMYIPNFSFQN